MIHRFMFNDIACTDNLFAAWEEFRDGKKNRKDVADFWVNLEDSIFQLRDDLREGSYRHGSYFSFFVCDPKRRHIHKAGVRDRLLHHAVVRVIEPLFDPGSYMIHGHAERVKVRTGALIGFGRLPARCLWAIQRTCGC